MKLQVNANKTKDIRFLGYMYVGRMNAKLDREWLEDCFILSTWGHGLTNGSGWRIWYTE